jgi:hypothetical protein
LTSIPVWQARYPTVSDGVSDGYPPEIPEEAYDFDNPEDVLRCWSPANITAMTHHDNMEKSWKLTDHWIASAGPACYPRSWQNCPPTDEMKKAHHDRMIAPKPVGEQLESPASDASDYEEYESDSEEEFEACGDQGAGSSSNAGRERTSEGGPVALKLRV